MLWTLFSVAMIVLMGPQDVHALDTNGSHATPGVGFFEDWVRALPSSRPAASHPLNLRVARALGPKGYDRMRISVIGLRQNETLSGDLHFTYSQRFKYRWQSAFDLGQAKQSCTETPYQTFSGGDDATCLEVCTADSQCLFYTFYQGAFLGNGNKCHLYTACTFKSDEAAEATYSKIGDHVLHSAMVTVKPGHANTFTVNGQSFTVRLPAQGQGTKGIIWSDPCFSARWVECQWGERWDTFNRGAAMINLLAKDPALDFFQILGDNFYDQDGRLTRAMFDQFTLDVKSKILQTVAGNHDLWVCGLPSCGDAHDQAGYGLMQFYAQDPVASTLLPQTDADFLSFAVNPDTTRQWHGFNNNHTNFLWYHLIGNLGFIGYTGAATFEETRPYFEQACSFMGRSKPRAVMLLGHWNHEGLGCGSGMAVPDVYDAMRRMPGCDIGDRLKYFDGHQHCNQKQDAGQQEEVGFMIGGHGMRGCSQYGFGYLDSTGGKLRIWYFEERTVEKDNYPAIVECLQASEGKADHCLHLATLWLETDLGYGS